MKIPAISFSFKTKLFDIQAQQNTFSLQIFKEVLSKGLSCRGNN